MRLPVCHLRTEAEYFFQLDRELIEGMRRRAASQQERLRMAEASHIFEPAILEALENLGFDHDTVTLLFVVPLVQVAWADGSVSQIEHDHIFAVASLRGTAADSPAFGRLAEWLNRRPPEEFFEGALNVISAVLSILPPAEREACRQAIVLCCRDAAAAPCHVIGWVSRVCVAKRKAIEHISARLESKQAVAA